MELVDKSVCPLSPFLWATRKHVAITTGSVPGRVMDLRRMIEDLSVNFDFVVQEFAACYADADSAVLLHHPLQSSVLTAHQFDVLRYGMVLDREQRLVLVEAPPLCTETSYSVARPTQATTSKSGAGRRVDGARCEHPLLQEHTLLVLRLPEDDTVARDAAAVPDLLFKLVFRNVARRECVDGTAHVATAPVPAPLYRLCGVLAPSSTFMAAEELKHQLAQARCSASNGSKLARMDPKARQLLSASLIGVLCDAWLRVAGGVIPSWTSEVDYGACGPQSLSDGDVTMTSASALPDGSPLLPVMPVRVGSHYNTDGPRLRERVRVIDRTRSLYSEWSSGEFDLSTLTLSVKDNKGHVVPLADPQTVAVPCARMILKQAHGGANSLEDGELSAFIPEEHEYSTHAHCYRSAAARKLRLWVWKGLATAEEHDVHCVLVDVDVMMLLSQCVGLLHGDNVAASSSHHNRDNESLFHVCKIVVETVEDFVQHSGVVWQVILAISEQGLPFKVANMCRNVLSLTQDSKTRVEESARDSSGERLDPTPAGEDGEKDQTEEDSAQSGQLAVQAEVNMTASSRNPTGALVVRADAPAQTAFGGTDRGIPRCVADRAAAAGCVVTDAELYPVFETLCVEGETTVSVDALVRILLEKLQSGSSTSKGRGSLYWPLDNPLLNLDSCGIPCNEVSIRNFVMGFSCRRAHESTTGTKGGHTRAEVASLNYTEFSMMMLALAYQ